jgi:hypothetical protein
MKHSKNFLILILVTIFFSISFLVLGIMLHSNSDNAHAVLTKDEAELCRFLSTDIKTGYMDYRDFINCCMFLDND